MSYSDNENGDNDFGSSKEESDSEHFQLEDEYADIDELCELKKAFKDYCKINSLDLCENLKVNDLIKFFNSN
jgi:hypothetical protein